MSLAFLIPILSIFTRRDMGLGIMLINGFVALVQNHTDFGT
jgi:hypothetical protein